MGFSRIIQGALSGGAAPPISFFVDFAEQRTDWKDFYELQLFLSLAEKHNAGSDKLLTVVGKVVRHENFFLARRAHAFLKNRKLPQVLQVLQPAFDDYERKFQR